MIRPPAGSNPFEFIVVSGQRAAQLMKGCLPKLDLDTGLKTISKAQMEVAAGKVAALPKDVAAVPPAAE